MDGCVDSEPEVRVIVHMARQEEVGQNGATVPGGPSAPPSFCLVGRAKGAMACHPAHAPRSLERRGARIIVPTVRVQLQLPVSRRSDADDERATQDDANTGRGTIGTCESRQKPQEKDRTGHHVEDMLLTSFVYLGLQPAVHGSDVVF